MTIRSAIPGPAPTQPLVPAASVATARTQMGGVSNGQAELAGNHHALSAQPRSHSSLKALARLLARQIILSGEAND